METPELLAEPWAFQRERFELILQAATRGHTMEQAKASSMGLAPEALVRLHGMEAFEDPLDVREGVAVIPVRGVLTRRSYWRGDRASHEWIGGQVKLALERPDVERIVFEIDSPGGQVNGCEELATLIYEARGQKPMVSYVLGQASSAAYWIASAADRIVSGRMSMLGSIGVIWTYLDWSKYDAELGIEEISIVSSQSPNKDLDPKTEEGRALVQAMVDQLAGEFVADVARNRGVDEAKVISDFGRGWVLVGEKAVESGLADSIGRLEDAITEPEPDATPTGPQPAAAGEGAIDMSTPTVKVGDITADFLSKHCPAVVEGLRAGLVPEAQLHAANSALGEAQASADEARAEGATAERERIVGILGLSNSKVEGVTHATNGVFNEAIAAWIADPSVSLESATKQYKTMAVTYDAAMKKQGLDGLRGDEANLDAPDPSGGDENAANLEAIKSANDYAARTVGL